MGQHVRKGDIVFIRSGRDRGRTGRVLRVMPRENKVVVEGMNIRTRHQRQNPQTGQGGKITKEMPIHMSNVSPAVDGKPTRVRFEIRPDGSKVRVAVKTGAVLGEPLKKARN